MRRRIQTKLSLLCGLTYIKYCKCERLSCENPAPRLVHGDDLNLCVGEEKLTLRHSTSSSRYLTLQCRQDGAFTVLYILYWVEIICVHKYFFNTGFQSFVDGAPI